jgi:hypothetical protein
MGLQQKFVQSVSLNKQIQSKDCYYFVTVKAAAELELLLNKWASKCFFQQENG